MDKKFLRGVGHLFTGDELKDGEGIRVARDFFEVLSEECYKNLAKYWDMLSENEHLFEYSDRQSPSYIMPALFAVTDGGAMCEMPLTRNKINAPKNTGYLDYWAHYRGFAWAIEAKQARYCISRKGKADMREKWNVARQQLDDVSFEFITSEECYIRLNLMMITFWDSKGNSGNQDNSEFIESLHAKVLGDFADEGEPNIWSYWKLPDEMVFIEGIEGEKKDKYYPCIAMYGHIKLVEKDS